MSDCAVKMHLHSPFEKIKQISNPTLESLVAIYTRPCNST